MESEASVNGDPNPWSSDTNWTVVRGTLVNSITFESSSTSDEPLKSPAKRHALILKPTAPDSNPCEITISFARKHELRQIYVKSSARVYEIYSQSNLQSEREYLWTVRCSAATSDDDRDDDDGDDEVPNGSRDDDKPSKENNVGSEEEWVSVKGPDDSSSLSIKPEFYEATAQISDVEPCLSVTLRLLSVQSKDSVIVDEIFVFADPIDDATESENHKNTNTNGNSLMAMLLPSLLQMSKTKTSSGAKENPNSEPSRKPPNFEKVASSEASFSSNSNVEGSKTEVSMDQLFSRIDRIEGLFLRLEENLLKPIRSIEARLGRVENHLEALNGKTNNTDDQPSCWRFSAPNFSSILSDSNSFPCRETEFESNAKRFHLESDDDDDDDDEEEKEKEEEEEEEEENRVSDMVAESSSVDQEPKRALTVDEALASALAGLMMNCTPAFTMKVPEFLNDSFSTEANENDSPRGQRDEAGTGSVTIDSNLHFSASPPTLSVEDTKDLPRVRRDVEEADEAEKENGSQLEEFIDDANSERTAEEVNDKNEEEEKQDSSAGNREEALSSADPDPVVENGKRIVSPEILESSLAAPSKVDFEIPVLDVKFQSLDSREASSIADPDHVVENGYGIVLPDVSESSLDAPSKEDFEIPVLDIKLRSLDTRDASPSADPDPVFENGNGIVLPDILEPSLAAPSKVDFEMPVLDVKFRSLDTQDSNFSLEALLSEFPESREEIIDTYVRSENEDRDLISVEDGEPVGPSISTQMFMDFNYCSLQEPLRTEDETPLVSVIPCSHDSLPTTLI